MSNIPDFVTSGMSRRSQSAPNPVPEARKYRNDWRDALNAAANSGVNFIPSASSSLTRHRMTSHFLLKLNCSRFRP